MVWIVVMIGYAGSIVAHNHPERKEPLALLHSAEGRAMLSLIGLYESGNDYTILYGGSHFVGYAAHPNIRVSFNNPATGRGDFSTAAGKYQINHPTYTDIAAALGVVSFTPADQDIIAAKLLVMSGSWELIKAGDWPGAIVAASSRWASLPGSTAKQGGVSMSRAIEYINTKTA